MYRPQARRVRRFAVWSFAVVAAIGSAAGAAILVGPAKAPLATSPVAASTVATTPAPVSTSVPVAAPVAVASTPVSIAPSTVVAVGPSSITVRSAAGVTSTYAIDAATTILAGRSHVGVSSIVVGGSVFVVPSASSPQNAATIGVLPATSGGEHDGAGDGASGSSDDGSFVSTGLTVAPNVDN